MAEREQIREEARTRPTDETRSRRPRPRREKGEKLKAELDDLLDEIDEVLETNAEDFVKSYIQKGGE
jgi:prokaryotic ubiquitin-like protein Pup